MAWHTKCPCCHHLSMLCSMTSVRRCKATWNLLLGLALLSFATQAPAAAGRKQKPVPTNTTFPSCNTGTSRITIANLDKLPVECRPSHSYIAAAVYACFETSRVRVDNCQVRVTPTAKTAKQSPICKLMYARGDLQGPSNASLVAVFSQSKYDRFVREHPDILHSTNAAALQQVFLSTLAQLFGKAVLLQGDSKCAVAAAAGRRSKHQQSDEAKHASSDSATAAATADSAAGARPGHDSTAARGRKRRPGQRRNNDRLRGAGSSTAAAGTAAAAAPGSNQTGTAIVANATTSAGNASLPEQPAGTTGNSSNPSAAVTNSSNSSSGSAASAADQVAASQGGRRLLLQQRQLLQSTRGAATTEDTLDHDVEEATVAAAMPDSILASAGASSRSSGPKPPPPPSPAADSADVKPCTEEEEAAEAEELFQAALANTSSSTGNLEGSVLYLQGGDDVISQPSEQCKFQYLVTRNPSLLQPSGTPSTRAIAAGAPSNRHEKGAGVGAGTAAAAGGLSSVSWIIFSSVSAVLAVVICYMVVKIVARRRELKDYAALKTSEAAGAAAAGGDVQLVQASFAAPAVQQGRQSSTGSTAGKAGSAIRQQELGDVVGLEDSSRLLKDSKRSDSSVNNVG